jgi:signal transduction histidine kinase
MWDADVALDLGVVFGADEAFVNGIRIGGEGRIGAWCVEAPWLERVYPIPPQALRSDGVNVVAIRVMQGYFAAGGLVQRRPRVGEWHRLTAEREQRRVAQAAVEAALFVVFGLTWWICALRWRRGIREASFLWFWLLATFFAASFLGESHWFYLSGWKTPLVQRLIVGAKALGPWVALRYFQQLHPFAQPLLLRATTVVYWLLTIGQMVIPAGDLLTWLIVAWLVVTIAALLGLVWLSARMIREGVPEATPLCVGSCLIVLFSVPEMTNSEWQWLFGVPAHSFGWALCLLTLAYALVARYVRLNERLKAASAGVLVAHEEERKRLARELHDGVTQSLLAIKFNLEWFASQTETGTAVGHDDVTRVVGECGAAVEELRRVARDLRPDYLERLSLPEAIRCHCDRLQSLTSLRFHVVCDPGVDVSPAIRDHLYRLCQEALSNVLKHANARDVEVVLSVIEQRLLIRIQDNGIGFDPHRVFAGVGLATMRERAELLGGRFECSSRSGQGTTIQIWVPLTGATP